MSEDHVSCVDKFDMYDIIDIRKLENYNPGNEEIDPDFTVTKPECMTGCPITEDGVIIDG